MRCEKHDWDWDISDPTGCPVCYGESLERERIIKLLEEMPWQIYSGVGIEGKPIESVWTPKVLIREDAIALIKDENRNITSEILPDGTIYIAEIKGENK